MPDPSKKSSGKSCLLIGCLGIIILCIVGVAVLYFGTRYMINNAIDNYTSATPVELGTVEMSDADYESLEAEIKRFKQALETQEKPFELVLTEDQINAYIARNEEMKPIRDKVFVDIVDDTIKGDVSIPLDQFSELPMLGRLKGRYFNGSATFNVSLDGGFLLVTLAGAEVNGEALPEEAIKQMSEQNLARDLYKDPKSQEAIRKLESIRVEDDKVHITVREKAQDSGDAQTEPETAAEPEATTP